MATKWIAEGRRAGKDKNTTLAAPTPNSTCNASQSHFVRELKVATGLLIESFSMAQITFSSWCHY